MRRFALLVAAIVLTGCSRSSLLQDPPTGTLQQAAPVMVPGTRVAPPAIANALTLPPHETFEVAGPNAHNELDYETLEGPGALDTAGMDVEAAIEADLKRQDGVDAEAEMAAVETSEPAQPVPPPPEKPKPGQVVISAVAVPQVRGSPGPGNDELTTAMRRVLKQAGWPVLTAARKDALTIKGKVELGKPTQGRQMVRLSWVVSDPTGKVLGNIKQENVVEAGSLDGGWGGDAEAATQAAAEGIFSLIQQHR